MLLFHKQLLRRKCRSITSRPSRCVPAPRVVARDSVSQWPRPGEQGSRLTRARLLCEIARCGSGRCGWLQHAVQRRCARLSTAAHALLHTYASATALAQSGKPVACESAPASAGGAEGPRCPPMRCSVCRSSCNTVYDAPSSFRAARDGLLHTSRNSRLHLGCRRALGYGPAQKRRAKRCRWKTCARRTGHRQRPARRAATLTRRAGATSSRWSQAPCVAQGRPNMSTMQLFGTQGTSEVFRIGDDNDNNNGPGFSRDSVKKYAISAPGLGAIRRVHLKKDVGRSSELGSGWFLERVVVTGVDSNATTFPCHKWIGEPDDGSGAGAASVPQLCV